MYGLKIVLKAHNMDGWRNGSRSAFRAHFPSGSKGSSPLPSTNLASAERCAGSNPVGRTNLLLFLWRTDFPIRLILHKAPLLVSLEQCVGVVESYLAFGIVEILTDVIGEGFEGTAAASCGIDVNLMSFGAGWRRYENVVDAVWTS